ncbi:MAG: FtsW/RodA/SpoVE family cell cycle protein, partial [Alphaproteobacteria bacterium]|nr:FtsW/RodA/SpoVE family cell cycle protein [Alphaproteobacteria bacterium]
MAGLFQRPGEMSTQERFGQISWSLVFFIVAVGCIGIAMLYSAADGSMEPWAKRHLFRFLIGMAALIAVAVIDLRIWLQYAYVVYGVALVLLVGVEVAGKVGMGAQRWISLGVFNVQPSELMKVAVVLALARYFHG